MNKYWKQNRDLREAHVRSLNEMEELKRFQGSTFDTNSRGIETLSLNSQARFRRLQNEVNCMKDSRDFKDAESVRSGNSHVTSQPVSLPLFQNPGGKVSRSLGMPSRRDGPPIFGTHMVYRETFFANPTASSSAPNPWISNVSEHTSPHVMSESQTPVQDQRCQSRPSASNSVIPGEGGISKNYGQTSIDCRFQILILTNSPRQQRSLVGRWDSRLRYVVDNDFLRKLCCGSKKWSWLIQWVIWNLRALWEEFKCLILKYLMRGIASALNRIILNTQFTRKVSLEEQKKPKKSTVSFMEDRSLTWSTRTSGSLEPMIPSKIMPTCLQLFVEMMIFRNSIRNGTEFYFQWRKSHLMISWKDCTN